VGNPEVQNLKANILVGAVYRLSVLCAKEPTLEEVEEEGKFDWLMQADNIITDLLAVSNDLPGLNDQSFPYEYLGNLYRLQEALIPFREAAYQLKMTREIIIREVVREVPRPEEDKGMCTEYLTASARNWSKTIHEMTDIHDRANNAIKTAEDIMREIDSKEEVTPLDVSGWIGRLELELKDRGNYNRRWFGLTDREQTILHNIVSEMRSGLANCMMTLQ
jgi:hypothetical protein